MKEINNLVVQSSLIKKEDFDDNLKLKFAVKKIAFKVLHALKLQNHSQKDLANMLDVSPQNISKMLKGEDFKISTLIKFEDALNINLIDRDINSSKKIEINFSVELFKTKRVLRYENQLPQSPALLKEKFSNSDMIFEQKICNQYTSYESLLQHK